MPGHGQPPSGKSPGQMHPQLMHEHLDAYEQHLRGEQEKIKAVRTLLGHAGHPAMKQRGGPGR